MSKPILCKCPTCEEFHMAKISKTHDVRWTGRGIPRIRCFKCKFAIGIYHDGREEKQYQMDYDTAMTGA